MESNECQKLSGTISCPLRFVPIVSGKFRRKPDRRELIHNFMDLGKGLRGVIQSIVFLKKYRIECIFSKGGFVSLPVVVAGWLMRIPIIVHESDTKPGLSTRIASWFTDRVFTGFPDVLPGGRHVGHIINTQLLPTDKELTELTHRLSTDNKPTIMINCGSLGSKSVHEAVLQMIHGHPWLTDSFHWIVLLGKINNSFKDEYNKLPQIQLFDFVDQQMMGRLYYQADVSICRGGSTTLVEQRLFHIKQIIVPIPWTHDQLSNATRMVNRYQEILVHQDGKDRHEKVVQILDTLKEFRKTPPSYESLQGEIKQPVDTILKEILDSIRL